MDNYDILVVGGGIHGCGVAQAAAANHLSALLLEQDHLASGTSSQSTKLIHGGLRYLEQMQLKLVYEALHERETLLKIAPRLVERVWFHIPVYQGSRRSISKMTAGLMLYTILSFGRSRYQRIARDQWGEMFPHLVQDGLDAMLAYEDAATDDAALTRAVAASATARGAEIREGVHVDAATRTKGIWHVHLSDGHTVSARVLVNAAGPWVNHLARTLDAEVPMMPVMLVQGSHLVLDRPCHTWMYVESTDKRAMFIRPWKGKTLIGTTETSYAGDPSVCVPSSQEVRVILDTYNRYFPDYVCTDDDVIQTFCGVRVLPQVNTAFAASRETMLIANESVDYVAIYGGKLTTYRLTAEKIMKKLNTTLNIPDARITRQMYL